MAEARMNNNNGNSNEIKRLTGSRKSNILIQIELQTFSALSYRQEKQNKIN